MNAEPIAEMTDEDLLRRFREGDQEAFGLLIHRHHGVVYAIAYARLRDVEAAEDLVQEVFLRAFVQHQSLRDGSRFAPWVCRMARNLAIDWLRRGETRSRLIPLVPMEESVMATVPEADKPTAVEVASHRQEMELAEEALRQLAPGERELVLLHFTEGMSRSDIARHLGVHPSTAGRQLDAALAKMRGSVEKTLRRAAPALRPRTVAVARTATLVATFAALAPQAQAAIAAKAAAQTTLAGEQVAATTTLLGFLKAQLTLLIGGTAALGTGKMLVVGTGLAAALAAGVYITTDTPPANHASGTPAATTGREIAQTMNFEPGVETTFIAPFNETFRMMISDGFLGLAEALLTVTPDGVVTFENVMINGAVQQNDIRLEPGETRVFLTSVPDPAIVGSLMISMGRDGAEFHHWMDRVEGHLPAYHAMSMRYFEGTLNATAFRQGMASEFRRHNIGPASSTHRRQFLSTVTREFPIPMTPPTR